MKINSVNIIGAGRVGLTLIKLLDGSGVKIKSVMTSRSLEIIFKQDFRTVTKVEELDPEVDLNIICVKDDAIGELVKRMPKRIPAVHTSGSVSISVFEGFQKSGIFYPLQTFSKDRDLELKSSYFLLEASGEFEQELREFCENYFTNNILFCNSEQRKKIHLAAVFANNFINHLLLCSKEILDQEEIDFKILEPLVKETISKAFDVGPLTAQTGPAVRNDLLTLKNHLEMLKDENLKNIYKLLTESIRKRTD